ncbi:MAG TPA: PSD1 and planctomycete cytochrome C domain-containing protein [Bryobacteraceae bacterium]|nr:PSD1 and planctomycete cytochrome C domain-containing protein [Bryobacteraceae bacterium]
MTLCVAPVWAAAPPQFEKDILPLLEARCAKCHTGPEAQGGLAIRTRAALVKGGKSGAAFLSGEPDRSLLMSRIRSGQMPPGGPKLADSEIDLVRRWIEVGAPAASPDAMPAAGHISDRDREHWAFQPPRRPAIPAVRARARIANAIDAFVLAALEKKGLAMSPEASRPALLRRLAFDLTGLPPSPEFLERFLQDGRPGAYERAVDELLDSPRYGERWARQWLDISGYADSEGVLAADVIRPDAWRYRDYVIRAFNEDKPYDRFVQEQIAGDELSEYWKYDAFPRDVAGKLAATGFLRTAVDATREDFLPKDFAEYQWRTLFDTEQILASSFLGLTMQCARCHDHKYEPITQRDYYALQAVLASAIRPTGPVLPTYKRIAVDATKTEQQRAEENNKPLEAVAKALRDLQNARRQQFRGRHPKRDKATEEELRSEYPEYAERAAATIKELEEVNAKRIHLPTIRMLNDIDATPPPTYVLRRGDPLSPGETVEPAAVEILSRAPRPFVLPVVEKGARTTGRRRAFAEWLTQPGHPLTARVMVNRVWAGHFGAGIVASLDNFGKSGTAPTHPELLDWLATEFVRDGWSLKKLHKLIVTSSAYRQSAASRADGLAADADNKLLWRMSPRRLDAESVRDAILSAAGRLDATMFGEPVRTVTKPSGEVVPEAELEKPGRRTVYQLVRRSAPQSLLNAFDAPVMEINCARRASTTSATQALALMNGEFVTTQSEHFARRLLNQPQEDKLRIREAFRIALSRDPSPGETDRLLTFVRTQESFYGDLPEAARRRRIYSDLCQALLAANEFIHLD